MMRSGYQYPGAGHLQGGQPLYGSQPPDYGYDARMFRDGGPVSGSEPPWQRPAQQPWNEARSAEPNASGSSGTALQRVRPKGPPPALPAGSSAAEGSTEPDTSPATAEVPSPTGTKPPPVADLPSVVPPLRPVVSSPAERTGEPAKDSVSSLPDAVVAKDSGGRDSRSSIEADDDTAPLPVISFDGAENDQERSAPRAASPQIDREAPADPSSAERVRDPFEPINRPSIPGMAELAEEQRRSAARTTAWVAEPAASPGPAGSGSAGSASAGSGSAEPAGEARAPLSAAKRQQSVPAGPPPPPGAAKMDQIKDLYLTAEAIGEDALGQHFEQVSDRQRQLIREYFDQVLRQTADGQTQG
jgi:hypothetical protein